ncbi:hypothetical protein GCM10009601_55150 [Streptomyces thermospinosisporus]|uniref:DUF5133 domain-containing protein n=1 Tax=Streptomyces thermospinosisporus TaxID=161482 RepID=A0ABN1Z5M0_9ACTN
MLRRLVDGYEQLPPGSTRETSSARARDLACTLCVTTGTRDVHQALKTAHRWCAAAPSAATPGPVTTASPSVHLPGPAATPGPFTTA